MATRRKARELALQMLYQSDLNPDVDPDTVRAMIHEQLRDDSLRQFAWILYTGVMERRDDLDSRIEGIAENWTLSRMTATDRNIIRLGAFELLHSDTPPRVAVDEAIELAKRFGAEQSPQFVNGILDRLVPKAAQTDEQGKTDSQEA